jgi:hypothetical protein
LRACITVPSILDEESEELRETIGKVWEEEETNSDLSNAAKNLKIRNESSAEDQEENTRESSVTIVDGWLNFSSISAYSDGGATQGQLSIEDELTKCFDQLSCMFSSSFVLR